MITEQDVRAALEAKAAEAPSRSGSLATVIENGQRRRNVARVGQVTAVSALLLVIGLTVVALGQRGSNLATSTSVSALDLVNQGLIFPVPEALPTGTLALTADYAVPGSARRVIYAALADVSVGGLVEGTIIVISEADSSRPTPEGEPIEIAGKSGTLTRLAENDPDWRGVEITWQEGQLRVSVFATDESHQRALRVAESVTLTDSENLNPASVSISQVEGATIIVSPQLIERRSMPYVVIEVPRPGIDHPGVIVQVSQEPAAYVAASSGTADPITVRGRPGYLLTGAATPFIVWDEQPGLTISVGGSVPVDDLTKVAEGIRLVDEPTWRRLLDVEVPPLFPTTTV